MAQDAGPDSRSEPAPEPAIGLPDMIQEIIVTARKREEASQRVPVSLTAVTKQDLVVGNLRRLDSLDAVVPNLLLTQSLAASNSGRVSLRGIGQGEPTSTADPAVGIYLDGVYLARFQSALPTLLDIERVEVLRGPQGTLFGKNTVGGAISIVTVRPEFELGGKAELRVGNFDLFESRLSLNVPLVSEKLAARINLATATRDGYTKNVVNGDEYSDNKLLGARVQLLALPSENSEILLSLDRSREDRKPRGTKCKFIGSNTLTAGRIATMADLEGRCREDDARSDFKFASNEGFAEDKLETLGGSVNAVLEFSPNLSPRSISAFRRQESRILVDGDGTVIPLIEDGAPGGRDVQSQWSQELHSPEARWTAGCATCSDCTA